MSAKIPLSIQTLHHRFTFYGRSAREWTRKCAMLLPEIERERVWEKKGFQSIYEYAGKLAGMSRESVNDALRVLRATEGMDAIREVIAKRGINAVKPVITALTPDNESFWAEKINIMSRHALETYMREMKAQNEASCAAQNIAPAGRTGPSKNLDLSLQQAIEMCDTTSTIDHEKAICAVDMRDNVGQSTPTSKTIIMDLDPDVAAELEKLKGQNGDWNSLMKEFLQMRNSEIEREAQKIREEQRVQKASQEQRAQEAQKTSQPVSRHIPAKIRRHVINKTRGQCVYPNCTKPYKILHHTQRFALNRIHDPSKITPLCTAHERIIHVGLIENEDRQPQKWRIRTQPDERDPRYAIDRQVRKFRVPG